MTCAETAGQARAIHSHDLADIPYDGFKLEVPDVLAEGDIFADRFMTSGHLEATTVSDECLNVKRRTSTMKDEGVYREGSRSVAHAPIEVAGNGSYDIAPMGRTFSK